MPSSVDLPTPEPAKMPRRWPRPHGQERVDRADAERHAARSIAGAQQRSGAASSRARRAASGGRAGRRRRSGGRGRRARGRAARRRRGTRSGAAGRDDAVARARCRPSRRAASAACRPSRKPDDLGRHAARRRSRADHGSSSPTSPPGPVASTTRPISSTTRPSCGRGRARAGGYGRDRGPPGSDDPTSVSSGGAAAARRSSWLSMVASTSPAGVRSSRPPGETRAVVDDLQVRECRPSPP